MNRIRAQSETIFCGPGYGTFNVIWIMASGRHSKKMRRPLAIHLQKLSVNDAPLPDFQLNIKGRIDTEIRKRYSKNQRWFQPKSILGNPLKRLE